MQDLKIKKVENMQDLPSSSTIPKQHAKRRKEGGGAVVSSRGQCDDLPSREVQSSQAAPNFRGKGKERIDYFESRSLVPGLDPGIGSECKIDFLITKY